MRTLATAALAAMLLATAACGGDEETPSTGDGTTVNGVKSGLKIAFLPKQVNNPYFTIADIGG
jgi:rhamnose transport system substrate-binding protein